MTEPVTIIDKRGKNLARGVGKRAVKTATELSRDQITTNVRNLAGNLWWQAQGAHQHGDHVRASQCHIQRGRVLAEAKRQDIHVGY